MSENDPRHNGNDQQGPSSTIPDGGLGAAMPPWLQQPPAWKREPLGPSRSLQLPPPDTSPIDPARLIAIDDLPVWLRDLAHPQTSTPAIPAPVLPIGESSSSALADRSEPLVPSAEHEQLPDDEIEAQPIEPSEDTARIVAAVQDSTAEALTTVDTTKPEKPSPPWWFSDRALLLLLGVIVVAMLYVVLAATGIV